jgi:membrane-anchored protein YejM (alkaline phosphatase superfamily)
VTSRRRFVFGLAAALLALVLGVAAALRSGDWSEFARAGAVMVVIGALVTAWESLREDEGVLGALRRIVSRQRRSTETLGLCLMIAGTLIWAFGDLVGVLLR